MRKSRFITVTLEQEGKAPATFRFQYPKLNEVYEVSEKGKSIKDDPLSVLHLHYKAIFDRLVEAKGFLDDDGVEITTQELKDLALPTEILQAVVQAYGAALNPPQGSEEEKAFTNG